MAEIKGTSLRVNEDDLKKFKEYMKEFDLTQAETFQAIINSFEMAKAKKMCIRDSRILGHLIISHPFCYV